MGASLRKFIDWKVAEGRIAAYPSKSQLGSPRSYFLDAHCKSWKLSYSLVRYSFCLVMVTILSCYKYLLLTNRGS